MTVSTSRKALLIGAAVIALTAGGLGYGVAKLGGQATPAGATVGAAPDRKPLYWYDPMVPAQHFEHSGKSPMGMTMLPKYAAGDSSSASSNPGVEIDPAAAQNLAIRLATVTRGNLSSSIDAVGVLDFNQRDVAVVQSRSAGFVQRIYARAPGDVLRAGAPIADLLVPAWAGAQREYLAVARTGDAALASAARERLRLLGMSPGLIASVERTGRPQGVVTITTPVGGALQTLSVRQGMTVSAGESLAQVTSLATVWLNASVPEVQAGLVQVGGPARIEITGLPGRTFTGRVITILPTAQAESRTLEVRVELPNPGGRLRPGMFATAHLGGTSQSALLVSSEAVIRTGVRNIVMLAGRNGRYQPVDVQIGREAGGQTEILAGLREGQQVVASGQFLLDSEASLSGIQARPLPPQGTTSAPAPAATPAQTRGRIEMISPGSVTISHEAVPTIGWPAMTMTFSLSSPELAKGRKVGDHVAFAFEQLPAGPTIVRMTPETTR